MDLRKKTLKKRDSLSESFRKELSQKIQKNLLAFKPYAYSKLPLLFYSFRSEVDTIPLIKNRIEENKTLALPKTIIAQKRLRCFIITSFEQLRIGAYSIMEPDERKCKEIHPRELDIVIVPGSVFDKRGARFGYGGGFYDRFLSQEAPQALRIALAFSFQVMDYNIPVKPHDEFMDFIVTEKGVIECYGRKKQSKQ